MEVITRKAAKAAGLKYYFTGKPCKRGGHIDQRYVCSFCCRTCAREKALEDFQRMAPEKREARREYERRRWQKAEFRDRQRQYARGADECVKKSIRNRVWKKENRASCTDRQSKRIATLRYVALGVRRGCQSCGSVRARRWHVPVVRV